MDHTRDPCPWVILNDFGGAFSMGVCPPQSSLVLLLLLPLLLLPSEEILTCARRSVVRYGTA